MTHKLTFLKMLKIAKIYTKNSQVYNLLSFLSGQYRV